MPPLETGPTAPPAPSAILVVEDDADVAEALVLLLEMRGHTVVLARDGVTGVQALQNDHFDIVFVDIGLPGIDGYEVAHQMRLIPGRSPSLVALTGYGTDADRARARAAGFDGHLLKPFALSDLERVIAACTRRA